MEDTILERSILWRNIVQHGHEFCRLYEAGNSCIIEGTAVFLHNYRPCRLTYRITCDGLWQTRSASVEGWVGSELINIKVRTDAEHGWWLNDAVVPAVAGSIDIDLNFSPSTNMLPIRRLKLKVGERAELTAAWLKFPDFSLVPLQQQYERIVALDYRYSSGNGQFTADLKTNPDGFVLDYPGLWTVER